MALTNEQQRALAVARARRRRAEAEQAPAPEQAAPLQGDLTDDQRAKAAEIGRQFVNADTNNPTKAFIGSLKASTLGAGGGAFEVANALLRRQIKADMGVEDDVAKELADEVLGAAAKARPAAFGTGYAVGAAGSGGAALKGISTIPKAGKILQFQKGQKIANTGRAALGGGAGAAAAAANRGEDAEGIATEGVAGAVAAPLLGAGVRAVGGIVNRASKTGMQGFESLANALKRQGRKLKPEDLRAEFKRLEGVLGRKPTLTELVGQRGSQDILGIAQADDAAKDTLVKAAERQAKEIQGNLSANIRDGKAVTGAPRLLERQGAAMDAAMKRIGGKTVRLNDDEVKALTDEAYKNALPPVVRRKLLQQRGEDGITLTIREMDDIRQAFTDKIKTGESSRVFGQIAQQVRDRAVEAEPRYGAALGSFARRARGAEGVKIGQGIRTAPTTEFLQAAETAAPETIGGARVGARTALSDEAAKSPRAAAGLAQSLADDAGLSQRLSALDVEEAARLQQIGDAETEALKSVGASVRGAEFDSAGQQDAESARRAAETLIVALGRGSGAFQANLFMRALQRLRIPPEAARKLTEMATNPDTTEEAIDILTRLGVEPRQIEELARAASTVGGRASAAQIQE